MKRLILAAGMAALMVPITAPKAEANSILRACLESGRPAATRILCSCIQQVADVKLSKADQRMAARFFTDPHRAQVVRQSSKPSHEVFWTRYKAFGATAESTCAAYRRG